MKFDSSKPHKLIIATVDNNGAEMYYYGLAKLEHYGGHEQPWGSKVEWVEGTVKRSAQYPNFAEKEIESGDRQITQGHSSIRPGRNDGNSNMDK